MQHSTAQHNTTQCAGAVVGVSLLSHSVPEAFGAFDAAFMTLFYVTGGDPWPDSLPKNNEDRCDNNATIRAIQYNTI